MHGGREAGGAAIKEDRAALMGNSVTVAATHPAAGRR